MPHHAITPLGAIGRGLLAGAAGTAAMTACQTAVMQARGGQSSTVPGQVAQRIGEGVFRRKVPDQQLGTLTQIMHWGYGTTWGAAYGAVQSSLHLPILSPALLFGAANWAANSALLLPALELAPPVSQRPAQGTAEELGYHLVYGLGVTAAYRLLTLRTG